MIYIVIIYWLVSCIQEVQAGGELTWFLLQRRTGLTNMGANMKRGFAVTLASFGIMRKVLLAATALLVFAVPAKADLVLSELVFRDLGGTGFGVAPRLLTLQNDPLESGGTIAGPGGTTQTLLRRRANRSANVVHQQRHLRCIGRRHPNRRQ